MNKATKKSIFLLPLFLSHLLTSQTVFQKAYGGAGQERPAGMSVVPGGYLIAGSTQSYGAGSWDGYLFKTDLSGAVLWSRTYGTTSSETFSAMNVNADGTILLTGMRYNIVADFGTVFVVKTDNNGIMLWSITIEDILDPQSEIGRAVIQTSDGNYVIAAAAALCEGVLLIKISPDGTVLWSRSWYTNYIIWTESIQEAADGGLILSGAQEIPGSFIMKTDEFGNVLWGNAFTAPASGGGASLAKTSDGGFIMGCGGADIQLIKTDADGNSQWARSMGGIDAEKCFSVEQTPDGGYIVGGLTKSYGAGLQDVLLIKTNSSGSILWTKTYGTVNNEAPGSVLYLCKYGSVLRTSDGGYLVGSFTPSGNIYLIKTDVSGNSGCNETDPVPAQADIVPSVSALNFIELTDVQIGFPSVNSASPASSSQIICISLPIEIISFTGKYSPGIGVILSMETAGNLEGFSFILERALENTEFDPVNTLTGKEQHMNENNEFVSWEFSDPVPSAGVAYYRLKYTDGENLKYSSVVEVQVPFPAGKTGLFAGEVSPNPVSDGNIKVNILADHPEKIIALIANVTGKTVKQTAYYLTAGTSALSIPVHDFGAGVYLIRITARGEEISLQKFMVSR